MGIGKDEAKRDDLAAVMVPAYVVIVLAIYDIC